MSTFLHRKLERLELEVASLLERGFSGRAVEKQNEICLLVDENGFGDLDRRCREWGKLAEIQAEAGLADDAQATWHRARSTLAEHLRARCPELLEASSDRPGVRHRTLDYDVETSQLLNRLAMLYHKTGGARRARQLLERAMAIARPRLGVDHPDFAILLANLAGVEHAMGSFAEAESLYRQALSVLRSTLGEEHPEVAETQGELAQLFHDRGRRREALGWYEKALETLVRVYGEDHPVLVELLRKEATLWMETGDLTAAEWNLVRARKILEARGGERDLRNAKVLQELTEVYRRMEDFARAEMAGEEALEIQRRYLGGDHPDCAVTVNNLAVVHHQAGRLEVAEELYGAACEILRKAPGDMTRKLLGNLANLELLYRQNGDDQKADALITEIEELRTASTAADADPGAM